MKYFEDLKHIVDAEDTGELRSALKEGVLVG